MINDEATTHDKQAAVGVQVEPIVRFFEASLKAEFDKNTTTKKTKYGIEVKCNKGLFSVCAPQLEQAQKEAFYYFRQYMQDGEYET